MKHRFILPSCGALIASLLAGCGSDAGHSAPTGSPPAGNAGASGSSGVNVGGGGGSVGVEGTRDPGRPTIRKLNRSEYDNTVHDLLGTELNPGLTFMNDAPEVGFDNNADLLTISPGLVRGLGHCAYKAWQSTLADTLIWLWRGYPTD